MFDSLHPDLENRFCCWGFLFFIFFLKLIEQRSIFVVHLKKSMLVLLPAATFSVSPTLTFLLHLYFSTFGKSKELP